jgi:hypothetical protein
MFAAANAREPRDTNKFKPQQTRRPLIGLSGTCACRGRGFAGTAGWRPYRRHGKIVSRLTPAATPTRAPYRLQKTTPAWAYSVSPRGRKRPSCVCALYSVVSYRIGVLALLLLLGERRAEDPSCDCLAGAERSTHGHGHGALHHPDVPVRDRGRSLEEENTWCRHGDLVLSASASASASAHAPATRPSGRAVCLSSLH